MSREGSRRPRGDEADGPPTDRLQCQGASGGIFGLSERGRFCRRLRFFVRTVAFFMATLTTSDSGFRVSLSFWSKEKRSRIEVFTLKATVMLNIQSTLSIS